MTEQGKAPAARTACEVCGRERAGPGTHVLFSTAEIAKRCFRNEEGAGSFHVNETCYRLGYDRERADRFALFLALRAMLERATEWYNWCDGSMDVDEDGEHGPCEDGKCVIAARAALRAAGRLDEPQVSAPKAPLKAVEIPAIPDSKG